MSRLIERAIRPWAEERLGGSPVLVVEGARQTGKSTLARMLRPNAVTGSHLTGLLSVFAGRSGRPSTLAVSESP